VTSRSFRFPVEAGAIALFARALGDDSPAYRDPESEQARACGGIVAPPTFTQAADHFDPEYDRRPRTGEPWFGSAREDVGAGTMPAGGVKGFHAEQEFEYHRPLRPGETLTATVSAGRTSSKRGRRGGQLTFSETVTEFRDEAGELVVTARFVGVGTERQVT